MSTIFTVGIFLSLFLSALLFAKRNKTLSDNILAIWMIVIAVHLLSYYLKHLGYWETHPHLVGVAHPFPLLHGPFLYLYVVFSLRSDQHLRWKDLAHFLPFLVTYIGMMPFLFGYSAEQKLLTDTQDFDSEYQIFFIVSLFTFLISGIVYPILAYKKVLHYQHVITDNFAYKEEISLQWLRMLIIGLGIIYLGVAVIFMLHLLGIDVGFNVDLVSYTMLVILVAMLGFFGIRYQGIFADKNRHTPQIVEHKPNDESYKKSGLKPADAEILHEKLLVIMREQKPYLEPKLTLSQLAEKLKISSNNLSQVINQCESGNFYDFVNRYRVNEFIELASEPQNRNLNLLGIAFDAGFNSKSSFNQVFKKTTGKTPREYLQSNKS